MDNGTPDSRETDRLLREASAGDPRAFEELFARYRPFLHQVVRLRLDPRLRARVDPSDVVQEAQLDAFRRLGDFLQRQPMPFRAWLRRTAVERLLKLREQHVEASRRSLHREVRLPDRSSQLLARQLLAAGSTPSQQLSRREIAQRVDQAMARLAEADHEILLMRHYEGLSYDDISATLEIAPSAARKRYGRALLRLQKLLAESGLLETEP
jgi:RNA polymerase sigma-70 factor (ECF subfamily)